MSWLHYNHYKADNSEEKKSRSNELHSTARPSRAKPNEIWSHRRQIIDVVMNNDMVIRQSSVKDQRLNFFFNRPDVCLWRRNTPNEILNQIINIESFIKKWQIQCNPQKPNFLPTFSSPNLHQIFTIYMWVTLTNSLSLMTKHANSKLLLAQNTFPVQVRIQTSESRFQLGKMWYIGI